nr:ATP-binding protein [Pedobacter panaciterrae]
MNDLSIFNWSLKRTLAHVSDPIERAKIQVFFIVFLLNFPKIGISLADNIINNKGTPFTGDLIALAITVIILKLLLARPAIVTLLIHTALIATSYYIIKSLVSHQLSIPVMQHIFMIITFSFYGLGRKWGVFYCLLTALAVTFSVFTQQGNEYIVVNSPYSEVSFSVIIIILNFIAIGVSHYYFHNALYGTLDEKNMLNEELQLTVKSKTDFLSTMSHELRTPLNSVIGMSNVLLNDKPNKEQKESLDVLKFSAESLLSLINNILDFNKIDSGKIELESIPFDISTLIRNACAGFGTKAGEKRLNYHVQIDSQIGKQQVIGDPTRLVQIIFNLVSNAIKFTHKGMVEVRAIVRRKNQDGIIIRFSVKDTGIGISPEKQKIIFEPFLQASKSTTRNFGGTGLGLSIVKHLLEQMGSKIMIDSEVGKGTRFYFDLKYATTELETSSTSEVSEKEVSIDQLRILLAEDNAMNILFMKKLLSTWNAQIVIAENGQEAFRLAEENYFDVILMDLNMPVMDGYEATKMIRKIVDSTKSNVHIIALTASASDEVRERIEECKMDDYLSKPFQPEELKGKLQIVQERIANFNSL